VEKKTMGACTRAKRYQLKTKTWFGLQKYKTVCFLPTLGSQKNFSGQGSRFVVPNSLKS